ncbi:MAG: putative porin, partial [Chitinophagales bacterium]|nr:putative porin [Chitinophagales bacterium]
MKYHLKQKSCSRFVLKILFTAIFISLIFLKASSAQDTSYRYYPELTRFALINDPDSLIPIDTAIGNFHRFNPAEQDFALLHNGFLGAPATFKFYNPSLSPDIDIGFHAYDFYWRTMEDVKFYNTIEPYTAFHYQQGSKSELLVNIDHAQSINRNLSLGINFNRFRTNGWYQRQESRISNLDGFLHFKTNSNKYQCVAAYVLNSLKTDENGGVKNADLFGDTVLFDKTLADINLDSAKSTWKNDEIMVLNVLHFGKWVEANKKDSTAYRKVIPKVRLQERFEWERRSYWFYDYANDGPYYVADTLEWENVRDTFRVDRIMNEVRLSKLNRDSLKHNIMWDGNVFFRHQIFFTQNNGIDQNLQSSIPGGELNLYFKSNIHLSSIFEYNILGRNAGDYHFNVALNYSINNTIDFNIHAAVSANHPSLIESEYHSTYYNWVNDFSSEKNSEAKFSFIEKRWHIVLSAKVFTANNFIYWNQSRMPQ